MASLTVNGVRLHYVEAGEGAPTFLFVHGLACDHHSWDPQFADLSRDHRCIAVDLRGRGESEAMPPYGVAQQADDVAALVRGLGAGPAVVAGHSLGGITALVLNQRHPDLVLGTVAADSPISARGVNGGAFAKAIRDEGIGPIADFCERFWATATTDEVRSHVLGTMLAVEPEVAAGMLDEGDVPLPPMLELVQLADRKPFMTLWAGQPLGDPAWLREAAPFVRQEPVADTGHFLQLERPQVVNALLRAFLDDVSRDPRIASLRGF